MIAKLASSLALVALSACPPSGAVTPHVDASDAAAWSCPVPGDEAACACATLEHWGCREALPTAAGATCLDQTRARLQSTIGGAAELTDVRCIIAHGGDRAALASVCRACTPAD